MASLTSKEFFFLKYRKIDYNSSSIELKLEIKEKNKKIIILGQLNMEKSVSTIQLQSQNQK